MVRVICAARLGSLSSWSTSVARTSCPVTRAIPRRSAASRCQMSRAGAGQVRSTVRRVRNVVRVRPRTTGSVRAAATEGVSGVPAGADGRNLRHRPRRRRWWPFCGDLLSAAHFSMSVAVYPRSGACFDALGALVRRGIGIARPPAYQWNLCPLARPTAMSSCRRRKVRAQRARGPVASAQADGRDAPLACPGSRKARPFSPLTSGAGC